VTEILGTGFATLRLACSEGIQLVDLTGVNRAPPLKLLADSEQTGHFRLFLLPLFANYMGR
jgi:hypothetical protein